MYRVIISIVKEMNNTSAIEMNLPWTLLKQSILYRFQTPCRRFIRRKPFSNKASSSRERRGLYLHTGEHSGHCHSPLAWHSIVVSAAEYPDSQVTSAVSPNRVVPAPGKAAVPNWNVGNTFPQSITVKVQCVYNNTAVQKILENM